MNKDRRRIESLLAEHFPEMEEKSSDDWHAFLNAKTGLSVPLHERNAVAFDLWRKALAEQGLPVWRHDAAGEQVMKERGEALLKLSKEAEARRAQIATADAEGRLLRPGPDGKVRIKGEATVEPPAPEYPKR